MQYAEGKHCTVAYMVRRNSDCPSYCELLTRTKEIKDLTQPLFKDPTQPLFKDPT